MKLPEIVPGVRVGLRLNPQAVDVSGEMERIKLLGQRILPDYPGEQLIRPIVIPPPEPFPPSAELVSYARCVETLAAFYRGALESRFGFKSGFGLGDVRKMRDFGKLARVVDAMTVQRVPPASWVLFSFDVWAGFGATQGPPTVAWTFSANRVLENQSWFDDQKAQYCGGRVYFAEEHLALVRMWRLMWDELMRCRPQTRAELVAIVEGVFPGDSYEKSVGLAQVSSRRLERYLHEAIDQGRMVWA